MQINDCFLCRKHLGQEPSPPGGYIYEDEHWLVCHAPLKRGPLGTLFIEARRHVLDFADFHDQEAATFGPLVKKIQAALRSEISAERIYQLSMMEGIPHFHAWLVPRMPEVAERGVAFLALDLEATQESARELAAALGKALKTA